MARGTQCAAHVHRELVPQESHHVWPLGYHGPNVDANRKLVCANAHSDAHYLLEMLLRGKPVDRRKFGSGVRSIAMDGFRQIMAYAEAQAPK